MSGRAHVDTLFILKILNSGVRGRVIVLPYFDNGHIMLTNCGATSFLGKVEFRFDLSMLMIRSRRTVLENAENLPQIRTK